MGCRKCRLPRSVHTHSHLAKYESHLRLQKLLAEDMLPQSWLIWVDSKLVRMHAVHMLAWPVFMPFSQHYRCYLQVCQFVKIRLLSTCVRDTVSVRFKGAAIACFWDHFRCTSTADYWPTLSAYCTAHCFSLLGIKWLRFSMQRIQVHGIR